MELFSIRIQRTFQLVSTPDDYKYIDLYKEYEQMRRKGEKVTYCVAFLSARHGVSERKVYEILGRFKKECTFHAV